jgi:hypothetical protein
MTIFTDGSVSFVKANMHCTEPGPQGERVELEFRLVCDSGNDQGMHCAEALCCCIQGDNCGHGW